MSMAARAISSRATSSISFSAIAVGMSPERSTVPYVTKAILAVDVGGKKAARGELRAPERLGDVLREASFELRHDRRPDFVRRPCAIPIDRAPVLEVGVVVVQPELHRRGVDQRLEALTELEADLPAGV